MTMRNRYLGFALVETVLVVVLLSIVGVTTMRPFGDQTKDSDYTDGPAINSRISSAAAINYSALIFDPSITQPESPNCEPEGLRTVAYAHDFEQTPNVDTASTICR